MRVCRLIRAETAMSSRSVFHFRRSWVNILPDLLTAVLELKSLDIAGRWNLWNCWPKSWSVLNAVLIFSFSPDHVNSLKKVIAESSVMNSKKADHRITGITN